MQNFPSAVSLFGYFLALGILAFGAIVSLSKTWIPDEHRTSNRSPLFVVLAAPVFAGPVIVISSINFVVSLAGEGPPPNHIPELYGRVLRSPSLIIVTAGILLLWLLALASAMRDCRRVNLAQQNADPPAT
ncbi:hypothetical protein [Mycobacteroides abscessus]